MFQFGSRQQVESESTASNRYVSAPGRNGPSTAHSPRDLGALLNERREAMGISLAEAEAATRIRQKYLAALESDEWHLLPGEVVGRGFLRNYATFLGLEPNEVVERRRTVADPTLAAVLAPTSAGSALPPVRNVDYRPREVDLREEEEGMETRELRLGPIFTVLGLLLAAIIIWFAREPLTSLAMATADGVQALFARTPAPIAQPAATDIAIINPQNLAAGTPAAEGDAQAAAPPAAAAPDNGDTGATGSSDQSSPGTDPGLAILIPTSTPTPTAAAAPVENPPAENPPVENVEPTATPTADALVPLPTPTPLPLLPTPTPLTVAPEAPADEAAAPDAGAPETADAEAEAAAAEEPPPVVAAACPDPRAVIASPGVNQVLSGVVPVTGTADHEALQYYKLEYAPGANAGGGFVYFDGGDTPIVGGVLGNFNTAALPNGTYTLSIVVVDQSGNFPPPCFVTVEIAN
ncbi:MAG: helix-turn-helix domain-containing protein [Caldilineaceae bacterium]|nr:helix-turn-helix domain-containing protein [Caldilineaceae bacterium]